ncbi:hypothetical protein [Sphingorhabdus sp. 109]|uniref:hypothetical protein n=1 Tax=Sphingorhabdus sp. 109 TaxID=2653173 RepID=UPI0012F23C29|nr:hypothetical protein [Sphingorhabdus sp. 109]VWX56741.1 Proprotein convertase P [Sphingorhabdus sp. 109]
MENAPTQDFRGRPSLPAASGMSRRLALALGTAALALASTAAQAAGTLAGTDIVNVAQATYESPDDGTPITIDSNKVTIKVDELLDVTVVSSDPGDVATAPGLTAQVLTYQVTNSGNGSEAFTLSADTARPGDEFDTGFEQMILDSNGNGVYDPGVDTIYAPGTNDPVLAPDESIVVFVLSTIPASAEDEDRAEIELSATANTGSGTPGTIFAGEGDGGGDAVVGSTGARDADSGYFVIQTSDVTLTKSATVIDPSGGDQPIPGATIVYQLVATTIGSGELTNLVISDDIPADTTYKAGSITLENAPLTDAVDDGDAGSFADDAIAVALGTVPGGQTRTITFQVTID